MALPCLLFVTALALWGVRVADAQVRCVDVARDAARAAARGDAVPVVITRARAVAPPGADVAVTAAGSDVRATVRARVAPAGGLVASLVSLTVSATAVAAREDVLPMGAHP